MSRIDITRYALSGLVACFCVNAYPDDQKLTYHVSLKSGVYDFDDPDGKTESPIFLVPQIYAEYDFSRTASIVSGLEYWRGDFSKGENRIKQDTSGYGVFGGLKKSVNLSYQFDLQFGVKLGYKELNFENREMLDQQGFLVLSYNHRNSSFGTVELSTRVNFQFGERYVLGVGLFSEHSEYSSYTGIEFGLGL